MKTEFVAKEPEDEAGSKLQGDSYMKTTYRIKSARDEIKQA